MFTFVLQLSLAKSHFAARTQRITIHKHVLPLDMLGTFDCRVKHMFCMLQSPTTLPGVAHNTHRCKPPPAAMECAEPVYEVRCAVID